MANKHFSVNWGILVVALWVVAASPLYAKGTTRSFSEHGVEIRFTHAIPHKRGELPPGIELYDRITIRSRSGSLHELTANADQALFDGAGEPDFSPSGHYAVLETLDGGYVTEADGVSSSWHDVPGCAFVNTDSGRIVDIGTQGECAGEFTSDSVWRSDFGSSKNLATATLALPTKAAGSFCDVAEETFFSCSIANSDKIVSVCGTRNGSSGESYLQYRFGRPGKIEFEYPANRSGSTKHFWWDSRAHADVADDWLWFKNDGFVYSIFVVEDHDSPNRASEVRAGILVEEKGSDRASEELKCAARSSIDFKRLGNIVEWKEVDD
jgi:hypothetical protein